MESIKIELLIKEYEFLRNEILDSNKIKNQILFSGLTLIGFIIGGSASAINSEFQKIGVLLLYFLLPFFCVTVLLVWVAEMEKIQRIANHQLYIENRINQLLGGSLLTFENSLRTNPLTLLYAHVLIVFLFIIIALGPISFSDLLKTPTVSESEINIYRAVDFAEVLFCLAFISVKFAIYYILAKKKKFIIKV